MTMIYPYRRDCWLYPLHVHTLSLGGVRVYIGTGSTPGTNTSLAVGPYYAVAVAPGIVSTQRLWTRLTTAITTALGSGTVTISAQSGELGRERIRVAWSGGAWALRPSEMVTVAGWMGADTSAAVLRSDASGVIYLPWSYAGAWWSDSPWGGPASVKAPTRVADVVRSSARLWDALTVDWGTQLVRVLRYDHLPSARVWRGRSLDPTRAALASLPIGDPNATFVRVWAALQDTGGPPVLIHHDTEPAQGLDWDAVPRVEAVTLWRAWDDYGAQVRDMGLAGDYWSLELAVRVDVALGVSSGWRYDL